MSRICFDYGHGGKDPGAVYKGRQEKDDVVKIGRKVARILRQYGVKVDETRTSDRTVSLRERSNFENKKNYDYFISFHRNAFKPEAARGVETYTYTNQTRKAKSLAARIQKSLVRIGFRDRGVKKGNFHVLRETRSPAILIEIGFIDNSSDNRLFDRKIGEISEGIAQAILDQLGIKDKEASLPSKDEILYRVMAGSFKSRDRAEKQVERLKAAGFDAVIMIKD